MCVIISLAITGLLSYELTNKVDSQPLIIADKKAFTDND